MQSKLRILIGFRQMAPRAKAMQDEMNTKPEHPVDEFLSVSAVAQTLSRTLETQHPRILFEGELSELKVAQSGHLYATIKDEHSQINIVLWAGTMRGLRFKPEVGMAVRCQGRPTIYPKSGRFQIVVDKMSPSGEGLLQKKFLALKEKLEKEGLFSDARKRPLPFMPRAIGIVTSMAGAAIHDMLVKLKERMPQVPLFGVDVRVQGPGAAQDIASGITFLASSGFVDVIITGRGGGSLEDLWAFNEEVVVRAIFASAVPIISAVGHEVDVTLADLVADVRAPTPTAAAELVVPRRDELLLHLGKWEERLLNTDRWFQPMVQGVDDASSSLERSMGACIVRARLGIEHAETKLRMIEPQRLLLTLRTHIQALNSALQNAFPLDRLKAHAGVLNVLERRLGGALFQAVRERVNVVKTLAGRIEALNPTRVLERGYSIVEGTSGIIRSARELAEHERIRLTFFEGSAQAQILERTLNKEDSHGKG